MSISIFVRPYFLGEDLPNDVCIYLKPKTLDNIKDNSYVDISDCEHNILEQLQNRPKINAASFGIPTIANWKLGYKEFDGHYIPVKTMDSLVAEAEKMKDKNYYDEWSNKIIPETEKYHISKIAEIYRQLDVTE